MMVVGTCKGCGMRRIVPEKGTRPIMQGDDIAFVFLEKQCRCGEHRVKIDMRQFDEPEDATTA